ncbi:MAG: NAD-dependent succinate-semialdehyde dehydrogenase [Pseudomonadota bacterium]
MTKRTIETLNPATGLPRAEFPLLDDAELEQRLALAHASTAQAPQIVLTDRLGWLENAARLLRERRTALAAIMTDEMGKPLAAAEGEIEKCAWVCEFYAQNAEVFLQDQTVSTTARRSFVRPLPLGVILAVMPWNFPFWQVFRFAAPALAAGNVVLLKHAPNTFECSLAIEQLLIDSGVPEALFQSLLIDVDQTQRLLADERVAAATLTGSERAGAAVAATAGTHLKKVVLELGGSDAFIVMPSADMDAAVEAACRGRLQNSGQSCIAAKRMIVHEAVYDEFVDKLMEGFSKHIVGDPTNPATTLGPLATQAILDSVNHQVSETVAAGARLRSTGISVPDQGFFCAPALLEDVPLDAPAAVDEVFGPVASVFRVATFDDAINLANRSRYGLGSVLFSEDQQEIEDAFNAIDAGATFINTITASDPRIPFGGIKSSGYGRELADIGMYEFMNLKTCWVA